MIRGSPTCCTNKILVGKLFPGTGITLPAQRSHRSDWVPVDLLWKHVLSSWPSSHATPSVQWLAPTAPARAFTITSHPIFTYTETVYATLFQFNLYLSTSLKFFNNPTGKSITLTKTTYSMTSTDLSTGNNPGK